MTVQSSTLGGRRLATLTLLLGGFAAFAPLSMDLYLSAFPTWPTTRTHRGGLRQTGRAFRALMRDRVFAGYALTVAFAYASPFGYISGSSFALQEQYGLTATQFSLVFAANAGGMVALGLLNARLVYRLAVRRILIVGLVVSGWHLQSCSGG